MKATLLLENGTCYYGVTAGVPGETIGEVIVNTAVVGYQEMMTDPANAGKILVFTYPLIGNYGTAKKFNESKKCWVSAIVMKEKTRICSNFQSEDTFDSFLQKENVVAITDVDTRTLTVDIRDNGQMLGIVSTGETNKTKLLKKIAEFKQTNKQGHIKHISVKEPKEISKELPGQKIGILDLGITNSLLAQLKNLQCNVTLLPYNTTADQILQLNLDGLIISSGPEEDVSLPEIIATVKQLIGKLPMFGISTGHEILCVALGGKLKKLSMGHHGVNYPVKPDSSLKGDITVQNHSYTVDEDSIKHLTDIKVSLRNINDGTVEEITSDKLKLVSVQYVPASPGFDEINGAFTRFIKLLVK
jgi:carbamoyl-phosphate synthase small subunit